MLLDNKEKDKHNTCLFGCFNSDIVNKLYNSSAEKKVKSLKKVSYLKKLMV